MIKVENLKKSFNQRLILKCDKLEFPSNAISCIYGPSGSGKTTLLNILAMFESYDSGEIKILDAKAPKPLSEKAISYYQKDISYISQTPILVGYQTVYENLKITNEKRTVIKSALGKVGLENKIDANVETLSGGERQRVSIALAILKQSKIIFADEPTGNLDIDNRNIILKLFKELAASGKAIIMVSHDPYLIAASDYCFEIKNETISTKKHITKNE